MTALTAVDRQKAQAARSSAKSVDELLSEGRLDVGATQEAKIRRRLHEMPESCRRTYLRAMKGRSATAGIKAFCMECVCWDRGEVARCTSPACPLYPYRPFKGKQRGRRA